MKIYRFSDTDVPDVAPKILITHAVVVVGAFLPIILDGAIAIADGSIVEVGPTLQLKAKYRTYQQVDGSGKVIIPGLFNSHTHVAMGFFRGLGHGHTNMIESFLFPAEKSLTPELLQPLSYSYILDGLQSGVTSFVDHYYFSHAIGKAFERMGVRAWLGETIADLGGAFPGRDSFDRAKTLIENSSFSNLISHVVAPHAADTMSKELLTEVAAYALKMQLPLHMHLSQTDGERDRVQQREHKTPVEFAASCGALGPHSLVVHMTSATTNDLNLLKETGATVGWCPSSTVIYDHLASVKEFFDIGLPLAIGTDCAASCDHADMLSELRTASLFARDRNVAEAKLSPDQLLAMATTIPAKTLGVAEKLGTLESKKLADLVVLNIGLVGRPIENPLANVIYSLGSRAVTQVMVGGKWTLWNRKPVEACEDDLEREYVTAVLEIKQRVQKAQL